MAVFYGVFFKFMEPTSAYNTAKFWQKVVQVDTEFCSLRGKTHVV